jgi:hypothetical protein
VKLLVGTQLVLPQLLRGSWGANAQPLSVLCAEADLIGDLSTFYGRVEELQWRLRYRAEALFAGQMETITGMTQPLGIQMQQEVRDMIKRVEQQIADPSVQEYGQVVRVGGPGTIEIHGTSSVQAIGSADGVAGT